MKILSSFITPFLLVGYVQLSNQDEKLARIKSVLSELREIEYVTEEQDYWQTPEETLELGTGNCEDFALLLRRRLNEEGISNELVTDWMNITDSEYERPIAHVWVETRIGLTRYVLEATSSVAYDRRNLSNNCYVRFNRVGKNIRERIRAYESRTGEELEIN